MKSITTVFLAWFLQALAAFLWLALLPTDTNQGLVLGYSASRLALLGVAFALIITSAALWRYADLSLVTRLNKPIYILSLICTICAPIIIIILYQLGKSSAYIFTAYAGRLAPLACWVTISALQMALFLSDPIKNIRSNLQLFRTTLFVLLILIGASIFIGATGLGITRYNDGSWGNPTTALLEWQIFVALIICLLFPSLENRWKWLGSEWVICGLIYFVTCLLWLSQPINPGFFATVPRSPNHEIYPYSDALIYAQYAQSALVGNGFMWPEVPTRPLYIAFITWLHALVGQNYSSVILLQTLVLAAFPVILYLLGNELSGRPLGIGLAMLAGLRDLTANVAAPFALNYSYTKLFFSEIPTALLLSLVCLMVIRWIKRPEPAWLPLLAGGVLGMSALIRLQSGILMFAILPFSFFLIKPTRRWMAGSLLMLTGLALAIIPWLVRNYMATGGLVLDNPISQTMVLARRWGGDNGNTLIPKLPGEGDAQYSSRMTASALASFRADPMRILSSATNHFFNNEIGNLLVFPLRDELKKPGELIWPEHAFWQNWNGSPGADQTVLIGLYLAFLALGLSAAWQYNGLVGLLPLAFSLVYNVWTALFLSSGDRFLIPIDWAVYLYLFLGVLTFTNLLTTGISLPSKKGFDLPKLTSPPDKPYQWGWIGLLSIGILFFGASVPLTELAFAKKYPTTVQSPTPGANVNLQGRAIYPRWYEAGEGEPGSAKMGYGASEEARLVFFLVGQDNSLVIFPRKTAPQFFPNAADVTLIAQQENGYLLAKKIVVQQDGKQIEYLP